MDFTAEDYKNQTEVCIECRALPETDELALPNARIVRLDNVANLPKSVKLQSKGNYFSGQTTGGGQRRLYSKTGR